MNRKIFYLLILVFATSALYAQQDDGKIEISKVAIRDVALLKLIDGFEQSKSVTDSLFAKRKGYIILTLGQFKGNWSMDTCSIYHLNINYVDFDSDKAKFPLFYTETSKGRPILIYDNSMSEIIANAYTDKSKQKFRLYIEPFLTEVSEIPNLNGDGTTIRMRIGAKMQLHGGAYIIKRLDGTYKMSKSLP